MNIRLKLDTTILQSNTVHHLIQYIVEQRTFINANILKKRHKDYSKVKNSDSTLKELNDDFEYITTKHLDALHKRIGTNIYKAIEENNK